MSRQRSLEMGDKRKQMQDQFDHRGLLLEQQEVLMLRLRGRLTALRRLSSHGDDQSAASPFREKPGRAAVYLSVTRLFTFCTVISLSRPQPDYINNQIISGFSIKNIFKSNKYRQRSEQVV